MDTNCIGEPSAHITGGSNGHAEVSDPQAVIFQCAKCKNVIADSTSWVAATASLRSISLSRKSNTKNEFRLFYT